MNNQHIDPRPLSRARKNTTPPLHRIARNPRGRVLAFDPGEHIGWALFSDLELNKSGEFHSHVQAERLRWLDVMFRVHAYPETTIVCESYRIYNTHLVEHTNSSVPTLRVIGAIELLCVQYGLTLVMQSAAVGKSFVQPKKLWDWGFYEKMSNPKSLHERDAITHALHYQIFGLETPKGADKR